MAVVGKKSGTTARWDKLDNDVCIEWTTLSQTDLVTSHVKSLRWITAEPSHDAHTRTGQAGTKCKRLGPHSRNFLGNSYEENHRKIFGKALISNY